MPKTALKKKAILSTNKAKSSKTKKVTNSKAKKSKGIAKVNSKKRPTTASIFSFPWGGKAKEQKQFSTNVEFGNSSVHIKSVIKGQMVHVNLKITSKNFTFTGILSLNARYFADMQDIINHIASTLGGGSR